MANYLITTKSGEIVQIQALDITNAVDFAYRYWDVAALSVAANQRKPRSAPRRKRKSASRAA